MVEECLAHIERNDYRLAYHTLSHVQTVHVYKQATMIFNLFQVGHTVTRLQMLHSRDKVFIA